MTADEVKRDVMKAIDTLTQAFGAAEHIAAANEQAALRKVCGVVQEFGVWAQRQVPAPVVEDDPE